MGTYNRGYRRYGHGPRASHEPVAETAVIEWSTALLWATTIALVAGLVLARLMGWV